METVITIRLFARSRRHAFMAVDMLFGIIIVMSVAAALAGILRHQRAAEIALANSRAAVHLAEHALLNLQHGQALPRPGNDERLSIQPAATGHAPAGFAWAKVDAVVRGQHRALLGVVPASSLPQAEKKS